MENQIRIALPCCKIAKAAFRMTVEISLSKDYGKGVLNQFSFFYGYQSYTETRLYKDQIVLTSLQENSRCLSTEFAFFCRKTDRTDRQDGNTDIEVEIVV